MNLSRALPGKARPLIVFGLWLVGVLGVVFYRTDAGAARQNNSPSQSNAPEFRAGVDLIAVDLEVIDGHGTPIQGLTRDRFDVRVGGKRREVVSAEFIRADRLAPAATDLPATPGEAPTVPSATTKPAAGQLFMLAIDSFSFKPGESRAIALTAKTFVDHLRPADQVGVFAYPLGPNINPTTDHAAVGQVLDKVVGQREPIPEELENLQLRDILALSVQYQTGNGGLIAALAEAYMVELEHIADRSFESLGGLMDRLRAVPGRKIVVLVSAGVPVQPPHMIGHPDLGDLPKRVGTAAAQAGATIYTLFVDPGITQYNVAEQKNGPRTIRQLTNLADNNNILEQTLDHFSGMAGGAFVRVIGGNPELAFDRIVTETSGYYLLGVRADKSDQDGKPHPLTAKVDEKGATVRGRSWVQIPLAQTSGSKKTNP